MDTKFARGTNSFLSNDYRSIGREYSNESVMRRKAQEDDFLSQEIDYRRFIFAPEGYEGLVLSLYFLLLPYLIGLGFLFVFIARASYEYFLDFDLSSYFVIWAIGYEVTAISFIGLIILLWMNHTLNRHKKEQKRKNNSPRHGF